jgi:hypothetical protein
MVARLRKQQQWWRQATGVIGGFFCSNMAQIEVGVSSSQRGASMIAWLSRLAAPANQMSSSSNGDAPNFSGSGRIGV